MNKFPKSERLRGKRKIEALFTEGRHFTVYPFKVVYLKQKQPESLLPNQILVAVPKRNFKRAVDRNRIKRLIKEAYRLNKRLIPTGRPEFYLLIGYIYLGKEVPEYQYVEQKLKQSLLRLKETVNY